MVDRRRGPTLLIVLLVGGLYAWFQWETGGGPNGTTAPVPGEASQVERAFRERRSDLWVEDRGVVIAILPDDVMGSRHQRFLLELAYGGTLLVSHNIDLAPRLPLDEGDRVAFRGEYEWNEKGGVVHWTHHDPSGRHPGGWLSHRGETYR